MSPAADSTATTAAVILSAPRQLSLEQVSPTEPGVADVVEAGAESGFSTGDQVFVPGANCFGATGAGPVRGLFGGASRHGRI